MFSRSSWLHLRIPFSYLLLPIFLFALAISPNLNGSNLLWSFISIHLFLYPASNGFNSYFDKDEKSIGGLKNPPKVSKGLYYLSLVFDVVAIALGLVLVNVTFGIMLFIYGLISKAYSHPSFRLKKHPVSSWLIIGVFQGLFTFMMCYIGINDFSFENALTPAVIWPGVLSSLQLLATYPITQVYQHEEDGKRGDRTMSLLLGIKGTFYFVAILFIVTAIAFVIYFAQWYTQHYALVYLATNLPAVLYFLMWFVRVHKNESKADYTSTMRLNIISSTCINVFFLYFFFKSTLILQAFQ